MNFLIGTAQARHVRLLENDIKEFLSLVIIHGNGNNPTSIDFVHGCSGENVKVIKDLMVLLFVAIVVWIGFLLATHGICFY